MRHYAEADDSHWNRGEQLELRIGIEPGCKQARQANVLPNPSGKPFRAEAADNHPGLESAKAATELYAVIHVVALGLFGVAVQVFVDQREGGAQELWPPHVKRAEVERDKPPLVWIDYNCVGGLDALHHVTTFGQESHRAPIGRINMEP